MTTSQSYSDLLRLAELNRTNFSMNTDVRRVASLLTFRYLPICISKVGTAKTHFSKLMARPLAAKAEKKIPYFMSWTKLNLTCTEMLGKLDHVNLR